MKEVLNIAKKCHNCHKAKCKAACPLGQDIPLITKLIKNDQINEAANIMFLHNPFAYVTSLLCNHDKQCYGNCLFQNVDFYHIEQNLSTTYFDQLISYPTMLEDRLVAIVGGGIAGLTIAHALLKKGIKPTIYEKNKLGGVIINSIPEFRFNKSFFKKHIEMIENNANVIYQEINVSNVNILKKYHHVIFTTGAEVENHSLDYEDVLLGIDTLNKFNNKTLNITNKKVAVIGLGNTACDVARALKRLNNQVKIIYRRDISSSLASEKEIASLIEENISIKECFNPISFANHLLVMQKNELIVNEGTTRKTIVPTNVFEEEEFDYVVEALGSKYSDHLLQEYLQEEYGNIVNERKNANSKYFTINVNKQKISVVGDAYYGAWNIANAINSSLQLVRANYPTYLFGGSFNPITIAHAKIINYLSSLSDVIIVPNGDKYNLKDLMSFDHRRKMIEIELEKILWKDRVYISEFEKSTLYKGSIETLRYYNHPVMVIGDDCLLSLHTWINAKELVSENRFLVITRNHPKDSLIKYLEQQEILSNFIDHFEIVELFDDEIKNMSSSSYRLNNNQDVLSNEVINYINNNKLYEV